MNFYIINATLTLDENIALHEKQAKLEKEIAKLEKQARAEKQPKKKFEFASNVKQLKKEFDLLCSSETGTQSKADVKSSSDKEEQTAKTVKAISILPEYAVDIFDGFKTVEWRS